MIKKTAWNTARVQTDILRQMDAEFWWGMEKIIRKMLKGLESLLPALFSSEWTQHLFMKKDREKRN